MENINIVKASGKVIGPVSCTPELKKEFDSIILNCQEFWNYIDNMDISTVYTNKEHILSLGIKIRAQFINFNTNFKNQLPSDFWNYLYIKITRTTSSTNLLIKLTRDSNYLPQLLQIHFQDKTINLVGSRLSAVITIHKIIEELDKQFKYLDKELDTIDLAELTKQVAIINEEIDELYTNHLDFNLVEIFELLIKFANLATDKLETFIKKYKTKNNIR